MRPMTRAAGEGRAAEEAGPAWGAPPGCTGDDPLSLLRGGGRSRPTVDRDAAWGLREWVEDELAGWPGDGAAPVAVGWWALPLGSAVPWSGSAVTSSGRAAADGAGPERGRRGAGAERPADRVLDGLVRILFRQWVTCGRVQDPLADALAGLRAGGDPAGLAATVAGLPTARRRALAAELARHVGRLSRTWPTVDPGWVPRTGERWTVPVAGGRAVLLGHPDLVLGWPARERASVGLVAVTAGPVGSAPWRRAWFAALVETLRSGAPPFQVSVFSTGDGTIDTRAVAAHDLVAVAGAVIGTIRSAADGPPRASDAAGVEGRRAGDGPSRRDLPRRPAVPVRRPRPEPAVPSGDGSVTTMRAHCAALRPEERAWRRGGGLPPTVAS